jgi:CRP-like cAMP-binding protein
MAKAAPLQPSALGLRNIHLLEGLPTPVLEGLARDCGWKRAFTGQTVISRDAPDNDVYMIVKGHVQVTAYSAEGRQLTYREMYAGECFGEFSAIDGQARSASVVAKDDSFFAVMKPAEFRKLLREHATVGDRVLMRLTSAVRDLTERLFELSTLNVRDRVRAEVLRLAQKAGISDNSARIDPVPSHAEIASNISTSREEVSRELSAMARRSLVTRDDKALLVLDITRLKKIVSEAQRSK